MLKNKSMDFKVEKYPSLGLIIVEHPDKSVSLDVLYKIKQVYENSSVKGTKYLYGIVRRVPGYYFSYNLTTRKPIVCGRFDKQETINETKIHILRG